MIRVPPASRRTVLKAGLAGAAAIAGVRPALADTLAEVKKRGELICATEMEFAPFDFLVGDVYTGVDRDLIDAVGKDLGVRVKYLDLPWTSVLPGLEARKFDFVIAPVTITAERMKRYSFTVPIAEATVALMKRADDASITKPSDLAGKTVGGGKGTAQVAQLAEYSKTLPKPIEIKEYVDNNQSYADLAAGRVDASVNSLPNLGYVVSKRPETFALVMPPFGKPSFYSWVGRLGAEDQPLTDAISAILVKMQEDGRLAAIQKKWFGQAIALPKTVPTPAV
jgi:polar amino acid transport system substrate-binding protein